jgi:prepilin peptidase CpaA
MVDLHLIDLAIATLFIGLLVVAAGSDIADLRIPNRISAALAALYPFHVVSGSADVDWQGALVVAALSFAVGALGFMAGFVGGGDVKLFAAVALWCGPAGILDLIILTGVIGGVIGLVMVTRLRFVLAWSFEAVGATAVRNAFLRHVIPYGVAIAVAGLIVAGRPLMALGR